MAVPGAVVAPVLGVAGFTANGVAAGQLQLLFVRVLLAVVYVWCDIMLTLTTGSAAAGVHGMIGNVAANSAFAILQSAGVGGYGATIVAGAVQGAGLAAGACAAAFGEDWTGQDDKDKDKEAQHDKVSEDGSLKK